MFNSCEDKENQYKRLDLDSAIEHSFSPKSPTDPNKKKHPGADSPSITKWSPLKILANKRHKNVSSDNENSPVSASYKKRKHGSSGLSNIKRVNIVSSPIKKKKKKEVLRKAELFGVPLSDIMNQQKMHGIRLEVPSLVSRCFQCLRNKFEEEGLFRKSGLHAHIMSWKEALDEGQTVNEIINESSDCHSITGLLKSYIRELPTPLVAEKLHEQFFKIMKDVSLLEEDQIEKIKSTIILMNKYERNLLKFLCQMLKQVSLHHEKNKMTVSNLARVWAPNFLWSSSISPSDAQRTINFNQHAESLTGLFIAESDYLFNLPPDLESPPKTPLSPKLFNSPPEITPKNSNFNLACSSYSQSVLVLPTYTHALDTLPRYSIPCITDTISTTEPIPPPDNVPRWDPTGSLSSTIPVSVGSSSATVAYETASVSEPLIGAILDSRGSTKKEDKLRLLKNIAIDRGRSSSSLSSIGTFGEIGEEDKKEESSELTIGTSTTPRPFLKRCSSRRKSYNIKSLGSVNPLQLAKIPSSPSERDPCSGIQFNSPLIKQPVHSPPLSAREKKVSSPSTTAQLSKSASLANLRKDKAFKKNKDKKRLPTSPIHKRSLKKRPGRIIPSKKTTSNLPALSSIRGSKRLTCYYQSSNVELSNIIMDFFSSLCITPHKTRLETSAPIEQEEAVRLIHSYRTLVIINKIGAIKFIGCPTELSEDQVKKLSLRKTNLLKSPCIFIKRDSILILGWSEDLWTDYLREK